MFPRLDALSSASSAAGRWPCAALALASSACVGVVGQGLTADVESLGDDANVRTQSDVNVITIDPNEPVTNPNQPVIDPNVSDPPAPERGLAIVGRAVPLDANLPLSLHFAQPNVAIGVSFRGSSLRLSMSNRSGNKQAYFNLRVDGMAQPKFLVSGASPTVYTLAQGLTFGPHTVWFTRRNEPVYSGSVDLHDVDPGSDGEILPPPPTPEHRIEIFGASTECGWCTSAAGLTSRTEATQDGTLAWPQLAADAVGASLTSTVIAGAGMRWDHDGATNGLDMPLIWKQLNLADPDGGAWDPSAHPMSVVLIDLIGNDDYGIGGSGLASPLRQAQWQNAATAFIEELYTAYPGVFVYLVLSGVYTSPQRTYMQSLMAATVDKIAKTHQGKVDLMEMTYDPDASSICGGHPTPASHQAMAAQAAVQIRKDLGW